MLDFKKPLRAVHVNPLNNQKDFPIEFIVTHKGQNIIQHHTSGHYSSLWACDNDGHMEGRAWRIENVPPEPVVQHCIAFLYNYRGSVCCGMVINRAALDSFFVNNPGKLLTYKEVSFDYINPDKSY